MFILLHVFFSFKTFSQTLTDDIRYHEELNEIENHSKKQTANKIYNRIEFNNELISAKPKNNVWPPDIPIKNCVVNTEVGANVAHFDCDDFAYAYKLWWDKNFPSQKSNVYQIALLYETPDGERMGHVLNILRVFSPVHFKFCLIEPQLNTEQAHWYQSEKELHIPSFILKRYGLDEGVTNVEIIFIWNEAIHSIDKMSNIIIEKSGLNREDYPKATFDDEIPFDSIDKSINMFERTTGIDFESMKPKS